MGPGLAAAFGAALCYGTGSVLQARAARRAERTDRVDPRLVVRLLRDLDFVAGLGLDAAGFLLALAALRVLPVFVVQAAVAGEVAVTAVVACLVLHARLAPREWAAVAAVCAGLAMLGVSAGTEGAAHAGTDLRVALAAGVVAVACFGFVAARAAGTLSVGALGLAAGLGFGIVSLAARVLHGFAPSQLARDVAAYTLVAAGAIAFVFFATALQRGSVTVATAAMVLGETVVPAAVGVLALGDRTRPGYVPVAWIGFALAVAGALALSRFGEPSEGHRSGLSRSAHLPDG